MLILQRYNFIFLLFFLCATLLGDNQKQKTSFNPFSFVLQKNNYFSIKKSYKGEAVPLTKMTISHGFNSIYRGQIIYTAKPGQIFKGPVYDKDGKPIVKGDILIKFDPTPREQVIEFGKAKILSCQAKMIYAKQKYERYKQAYEKDAIKLATLQLAESDYYKALAELKEQKHKLWMDYFMLKMGTYRAQFDGIVTKVFMPAGWVAGELQIMEVAQLFPMGVKVKLKREVANQITPDTIIKVYPPFGSKAMGVDHNAWRLDEDGITFFINNYLRNLDYEFKTKNGKSIPVIDNINTIFPFEQDVENSPIGIRTNAIKADDRGKYLWKAVGQSNLNPDKGIASSFKIKKVYVTLNGKYEAIEPGFDLVNLKPNQNLKAFDVVLGENAPKDLKDGQLVYYCPRRYLFMPGDPVKVEIGGPSK